MNWLINSFYYIKMNCLIYNYCYDKEYDKAITEYFQFPFVFLGHTKCNVFFLNNKNIICSFWIENRWYAFMSECKFYQLPKGIQSIDSFLNNGDFYDIYRQCETIKSFFNRPSFKTMYKMKKLITKMYKEDTLNKLTVFSKYFYSHAKVFKQLPEDFEV